MPSDVSTAPAGRDRVRTVEELERELAAARQQERATAEVLRIISTSPADLGPVLEMVAANAARICAADEAHIWQRDGRELLVASSFGAGQLTRRRLTISRQSVVGRAVQDRMPVHVEDLAKVVDTEFPDSRGMNEIGNRTILAMPLLWKGEAVGAIMIRRKQVRPFAEAQVALLATFADQAVIAIENTRLFEEVEARTREVTEALQYQTATSEVLQVISSSPGALQLVYETMLAKALRHCDAKFGGLFRYEDGKFRSVAGIGIPDGLMARWGQQASSLTSDADLQSLIANRQPMQTVDLRKNASYLAGDRFAVGAVERGGARSALLVPLVKDDALIGALAIYRQEVQPFTEKQVQLVTTFADQAVIAIENTRLFEEVQEKNHALTEAHARVSGALERETATSQILRVIGSSPTDVQPVFDTIARSGVSVCGALGCVVLVVEDGMIRVAATHGVRSERLERFHRDYPVPLSADTDTARTIRQRRIFHLADIESNPNATASDIEHARLASYRTRLMVPMVRGDRTLGLIAVTREDPTPFPDQLVELLKTFADQAVIAIENTRMFEAEQASKRELQESLEYQTATSEVLGVISRSKFDLQPVLDTLVKSAAELCQADIGVIRRPVGDAYPLAATHGLSPEQREHLERYSTKPDRGSAFGRAIVEGRTVHIPDVLTDPEFNRPQAPSVIGVRTAVGVPLMREGAVIGVLMLLRRLPQPFSQKQIDLVETFADQAVIAIENTRLFEEVQARSRELTQSLEYQTATSGVLDVISRSPNALQPVLDAIVASAAHLCEAEHAIYFRVSGGRCLLIASNNVRSDFVKYLLDNPIPVNSETAAGRAALERRSIHIPDLLTWSDYTRQEVQNIGGQRSVLCVPLLRADTAIGVIALMRSEVRPFTDRQMKLIETFADQAVIAIENARLFEAEQARTLELTEALEQQMATSEVLQVISSSPGDLGPVFDAMLANAVRMCGAKFGTLYLCEGEGFRAAAMHNAPPSFARERIGLLHPGPHTSLGRAARTKQAAQVGDIAAGPAYLQGEAFVVNAVELAGFRAVFSVPLLKDNELIGAISIYHQEVHRFSHKEIALVENFASQAVIAIENTRLLSELRVSLRQLEIASQHKSQFVANMSH